MALTKRDHMNEIGPEIYKLITELYPLCRSITGNGLRATLERVRQHIPLEIHEVPTGTAVFDWTIPKEWNIRDAYVRNSRGQTVVDFQKSNLHVVNYSVPVKATMSLEELKKHLFTLPEHPDWIPYRTTYYKEGWGFCLSHKDFSELEEGEYDVLIDSSLEPGHLSYGECYIEGKTPDEVLISCHTCHPSLCNDNLSGVALATFLAKQLRAAFAPIFIQVSLHSRNHRFDRLALAQSKSDRPNQARARVRRPGRRRQLYLQEKSAGQRRNRSRRCQCPQAFRRRLSSS